MKNQRCAINGITAETEIETTYGVHVSRNATIDFPCGVEIAGYIVGEIKSVEKPRRKDNKGYSRITIETKQVRELKEKDLCLLVHVGTIDKTFIVKPEYLNGSRQISWKKLHSVGIEI